MLRRLHLLLAVSAAAGPVHGQDWRARLDSLLDRPPLDRHLWGVAIADSSGRLLYGRNAERLFTPASNTKLAVAAAAAVLLPADLAVHTSVYATGPVRNGVLHGDLVLYGRGDPSMSRRCFHPDTTRAGACRRDPFEPLRSLALQLLDAGVREVAGDVIGDGSWFGPEPIHPTWESGDLAWWYAAPVTGLGFTDNSLELLAVPAAEGAPATLTLWPDLGDVTLENRTRTGAPGTRRSLTVTWAPGPQRLVVAGDVPIGQRPRTEYVSVPEPTLRTATAFRNVLAQSGIATRGATRSTNDSLLFRVVREGTPLAEVASRPLRDWLVPILGASQNWYAEMLLKQMGRLLGTEGTWSGGREVIRGFLIDSVGIDSTQFSLSDGSGLSTLNLVSPAAFVRLLAYVRRHPAWPVFVAGMPVAARSGTLETRFLGTALEGRVIAKTGTLSGGNALSGYLELPAGGTLIFSVVANHHTLGSRSMISAIDSVVAAIGSCRVALTLAC